MYISRGSFGNRTNGSLEKSLDEITGDFNIVQSRVQITVIPTIAGRKDNPMQVQQKLGFGAFLAVIGGAEMVFAQTLGFTSFDSPWSFVAGFFVGLFGGSGIALSNWGFIERRSLRRG